MKPKQGVQVRLIAGSIVLALTLSPFATAQDATPSQTTSPSASRPSEEQLPDSPGAVQARPNHRVEIAAVSAQQDDSEVPQSGQTAPPEPNPATEPPSAVSSPPSDSTPSSEPTAATPTQSDRPSAQPSAQSQQAAPPQAPREPVGTAAAESVQTTGVAASRPAGAALAPAKQRRMRSILIKVGALVGVGVAVGTTLALSQGSPSKPPGSR